MYCQKCGTQNDDNAYKCVSCGEVLKRTAGPGGASAPAPAQTIPNYLIQAILVTVFCCLPFGIVSIVYAAQVNGKVAAGDIAGAKAASDNAKKWSWISLGCGIAIGVIYAILILIGATSR